MPSEQRYAVKLISCTPYLRLVADIGIYISKLLRAGEAESEISYIH
jgi:hypothetical protein